MESALKWWGGKHYLAAKLRALADRLPAGTFVHVVETHCGGCAFTLEGLAGNRQLSFAVNDVDGRLTNFWRVLASPELFAEFARRVQAIPFSQPEWEAAACRLSQDRAPVNPHAGFSLELAVDFFVVCRQSRSGQMRHFAPLTRKRLRQGMNEQAAAWMSCVDGLGELHSHFRKVAVLGPADAAGVVRKQDGPATLFYLDPPYHPSTRACPEAYGAYDMTEAQHEDLLVALGGPAVARVMARPAALRPKWWAGEAPAGHFLLSGYRCAVYDAAAAAAGWSRADFDLPMNVSAGASKRRMTESVWMNF